MRVASRRPFATAVLAGLVGLALAAVPAQATDLGDLLAGKVCRDGFHAMTDQEAAAYDQAQVFSGTLKTNDGTFDVTYTFSRDFTSAGCVAVRVTPAGSSKTDRAPVAYSSFLKNLDRGDWVQDF